MGKELIKNFTQLFKLGLPLGIHKSQRPFVWDNKKIERFIEDIEEFAKYAIRKDANELKYYMGTIVFFKNEETNLLELIDGQQRMTTLLIFDHVINKEKSILAAQSNSVSFKYSSSISLNNIQSINAYLLKHEIRERVIKVKEILANRLVFTVIITKSEDEAFIYFDTQNNRGKKPSIDVVLKAVHLRGVHQSAELQEQCAITWENIENYKNHKTKLPGAANDFIYPFIKNILWRNRNWKYNQAKLADDEDIEKSFSRSLKLSGNNEAVFYKSRTKNHIVANVFVNNKQLAAVSNNKKISKVSTYKKFPFQLRQPLNKGAEFFLYMHNYAMMYKGLFGKLSKQGIQIPSVLIQLRDFYKDVYLSQSAYMQQYFTLCIIAYYDKFGEDKLLDYALALDYTIGNERLSTYYIYEVRFINKNKQYNILDAIQMSYQPEEVIKFLVNQEDSTEQQRHNQKITTYINALSFYYTGKKGIRRFENDSGKIMEQKYYRQLSSKRKSWLLAKLNSYD